VGLKLLHADILAGVVMEKGAEIHFTWGVWTLPYWKYLPPSSFAQVAVRRGQW
jgi:hypothetical protein